MSSYWRRLNPLAMPFDEEGGSGGSGHEELELEEEQEQETETEEDPNQNEDPDLQTPTEESPFKNPALAGKFKSEQELAEFLSVQDSALRAATQRAANAESQRGGPEPEPEPEPEDAQEFFQNPHAAVRNIIGKELKQIVAPLLGDLAQRRHQGAWSNVAAKYENFERFRPAVEETLRAWNIPADQHNEELIERVFLSEVGKAAVNGSYAGTQAETAPNGDPPTRMSPQHRPSSHPSRSSSKEKPKIKLTEEERRLARIQFRNTKDKDGNPVDPEEAYIEYALAENRDGHFLIDED